MLTTKVHEDTNLVTIDFDGALDADELRACQDAVRRVIERHGTVRIIERYRNIDWRGIDVGALWQDLKSVGLIGKVQRCAVLGDSPTLQRVTDAVGHLLPVELKTFDTDDFDAAFAWIQDESRRS
ncbi:SpoIIAA family protein [Nigerium massiliense]